MARSAKYAFASIKHAIAWIAAICHNPHMVACDSSDPTPSDAAVTAWTRLRRVQLVAQARLEAALKLAGLPPAQWHDLLLELERASARGLRPGELEGLLLIAQYNLSRLLDRMERQGLVRRAPHAGDGRGQVVEITPRGRDVRRRMWAVQAATIEALIGERLSGAEASMLSSLLGWLVAD
jgi:DNA-binding MarR family transcriptional regulator